MRADFVKETTTTTGLVAYELAGAAVGFQGFVTAGLDTETVTYAVTDGISFEVATGVVASGTPDTLSRASVLASSNAGGPVNWGAGTKTVKQVVSASELDAFLTSIADNSVTNAKLSDVATSTIKGRVTAGTGNPEDLSVAQAQALILTNNVITNARLEDMATETIKGRVTASTGDPEDLTKAQVQALIGGSGLDADTLDGVQATGFYQPSNILGTVSQSAGVPTGAIIEEGSNANGEYVKFADGTMICSHVLSSSNAGEVTWTFPASFSASPIPVGTAVATNVDLRCYRVATISASNLTFSVMLSTDARSTTSARHIAIGRWF